MRREAMGRGMAAGSVYTAVLLVAAGLHRILSVSAGAPKPVYPFASGTFDDWLVAAADSSLAGVVEEPVYMGLLVVLWPRLRLRTVIALAVISSAVRTVMHLYYAAGAHNLAAAVAIVAVWCTAWSTTSLLLVYWTRRLWPVMAAHGLANVFGTTSGGAFTVHDTVLHTVVSQYIWMTPMLVLAARGGWYALGCRGTVVASSARSGWY